MYYKKYEFKQYLYEKINRYPKYTKKNYTFCGFESTKVFKFCDKSWSDFVVASKILSRDFSYVGTSVFVRSKFQFNFNKQNKTKKSMFNLKKKKKNGIKTIKSNNI